MKRAFGIIFAGLLIAAGVSTVVFPQGAVTLVQLVTGGAVVSGTNPLPVSGSFSAAGFAPVTTGTPISVTTGGVTGTLPAGTVVVASNVGTTNTAYCKLGASATTSDQPLSPNGGWFAFTVGANTQLTCITSTSTTTVNMVGGSGLPTGTGGGGGSGGGGAVTVADGADVTQGTIADAAVTAGGTGTLSAKLRYMTTQLDNINTNVQSAIPAGTNTIGSVKQTDGTNVVVTDPCQAATKLYKAFSQTATAVLVTGAASKKTYVCSMSIIAGAAEIFNLTAGTGSTCGTNAVAVMGSTTAANGLSLAANGGLTFGNGAASLAATTVNQDDLCLQQSGSNRLSGSITYVQL